ncbi:STAS domain-containing protein [Streptomyces sp. NPDC026672]|uniref:STAS domain-containing protein n=1 Tax=unclassified Streptomyces TaxID=2593676 RepID=UPI00340D0B94
MPQQSHIARSGSPGPFPAPARITDVPPAAALSSDVRVDGERTVVTLRGELDLDVERELYHVLSTALRTSVRGIDLDLAAVGFCDCSGLNTLLTIRREAHRRSKTVTIGAVGPAVCRTLTLTGSLSLFTTLSDPVGTADGDAPECSEDPAGTGDAKVIPLRP